MNITVLLFQLYFCRPWQARLNNPAHVGWCDTPGNIKQPYLQIDFNRRVVITGVATQGKLGNRIVKSYKLAFTNNNTFWQIYPDVDGKEKVRDIVGFNWALVGRRRYVTEVVY